MPPSLHRILLLLVKTWSYHTRRGTSMKKVLLPTHNSAILSASRTFKLPSISSDRSTRSPLEIRHLKLLGALFGIDHNALKPWLGAIAYCNWLEKQSEVFCQNDFQMLWKVLGQSKAHNANERSEWLCSIVEGTKEQASDNSLEECWRYLLASASPTDKDSISSYREDAPTLCLAALFAVMCWLTMSLTPLGHQSHVAGTTCIRVERTSGKKVLDLKSTIVDRPMSMIFRQLQPTMRTTRWRNAIGGKFDGAGQWPTLHKPSLSYASLHNICKIRVEWTDTVTSHLEFDAAKRKLSVFRFPSFSALNALAEETLPPLIKECLSALYSIDSEDQADTSVGNTQVHREILLSYRLLFGQSKSARRLAIVELLKLKTDEKTADTYDSFLNILCTQPFNHNLRHLPSELWPHTCLDSNGHLHEQNVYSSQDDFPMFGMRLAKLQEFCLRQQPSKLRRDRRNPLQWYTFWVVTVFGGVSILLSLLQLLVGAAQLVVAVRMPNDCRN